MSVQLKKIIAFSLWGDEPRYLVPAVLNAQLAPKVYHGWDVYFYVSDDLDDIVVGELKSLGCSVIYCGQSQGTNGMMWRLQATGVDGVDVVIFRDADSLISEREADIVDCWLRSSYVLSIMRDHPWHAYPILGGMWGVRGVGISYVKDCVRSWFDRPKEMSYFEDQMWLYKYIYLNYKGDMYIHSPYLQYAGEEVHSKAKPKFVSRDFIGCIYGEEAPCDKSYIPRMPLCIALPDTTTNMVGKENPFTLWRKHKDQSSLYAKSKRLLKQFRRVIKKGLG